MHLLKLDGGGSNTNSLLLPCGPERLSAACMGENDTFVGFLAFYRAMA